jgi:hypothetical protein
VALVIGMGRNNCRWSMVIDENDKGIVLLEQCDIEHGRRECLGKVGSELLTDLTGEDGRNNNLRRG